MRSVVSEFDTLGTDLGFDTLPWEVRAERAGTRVAGAAWRPAGDRGPCRTRPLPAARERAHAGGPRIVARRVAGRAHGSHPLNRVQRAQIGFATLAVSALVTAVAIAGLIGLAQLRSGNFGSEPASVVELVPAPPK